MHHFCTSDWVLHPSPFSLLVGCHFSCVPVSQTHCRPAEQHSTRLQRSVSMSERAEAMAFSYMRTNTHRDSSMHTLSHTHTLSLSLSLTHTHTHVGFYGLRGLSIGVMFFLLYKLYVQLPYTYPTPKLSPHRRRCISTFPQKNSLCMIYKHFKLWGHWKCPHKSPSPCNTYVIPMSLYKFVSS